MPGIFVPNLKRNSPLIIKIIRKLIKNQTVTLYNPNSSFNNITDAEDIYKVIKIFLNSKKNISGFYNLASSQSIKIFQLISFLKKKLIQIQRYYLKKPSKLHL